MMQSLSVLSGSGTLLNSLCVNETTSLEMLQMVTAAKIAEL